MDDTGTCVEQAPDGGYLVAGITKSGTATGSDIYLVKINSQGQQEWAKNIGATLYDQGMQVRATKDGGYVVVGRTFDTSANRYRAILLKIDSKGNQEWAQTSTLTDRHAEGQSVQQTTDGGYILAGWVWTDGDDAAYLMKTDSRGTKEWEKMYGGNGTEAAYSVQQASDGGYIMVGETNSSGAGRKDMYVVKTDAKGSQEWSKTFGGTVDEIAYSIQKTSDGGYILAGETDSFGAYKDGYLVKIDAKGDQQWYKVIGGNGEDFFYFAQQTKDGGYIAVGSTTSFGRGGRDVYLVKTDEKGNQLWYRTFGEYTYDSGWWVQQTADGGYIIAGSTNSSGHGVLDALVIKTDADGKVQ
ncbi:MAG: hypothetical protein HYX87_08125 [Chloroflexi bacterium]|nr:hypothetical protein [Chloroflexota bacterium]